MTRFKKYKKGRNEMKRKFVSLLLAFSMILTLLPVHVFAVDTANPFRDVKQDDWFYGAVQYSRVNGFFAGTASTQFSPNDAMTRGMFVTVLGQMVGADAGQYQGKSAFSDVPEDAYYAPYVAWAYKYGVTAGTGDGKFSPDVFVTREQMATFFVNYFNSFGVDCGTGVHITTAPADIDRVSPYAREAVLKLWQNGLLVGDGVNFNPDGGASRAQAAMICYKLDQVVETWYKEPGVASDRVKLDPATGMPYDEPTDEPTDDPTDDPAETDPPGGSGSGNSGGNTDPAPSDSYSVTFYDGARVIETFSVKKGEPLGKVPSVSKSSKADAILVGYYTDPGFTTPFYAENPVTGNMNVYAKYEDMATGELTIDSFARMDQEPNVSFRFKPLDGTSGNAQSAVTLAVKDGSDFVKIEVVDNADGTYTVRAANDAHEFNKGCSYELTLAEGWTFLPDGSVAAQSNAIRTAAFSIKMVEVENLQMNKGGITYIQDTVSINYQVDGKTLDILANGTDIRGGGSFNYDDASDLQPEDILCIYVGKRPDTEGRKATDPAVYVKVGHVDGDTNTVHFVPLDENDKSRLYDIPDNFPIKVDALPTGENGTVDIKNLDVALYAQMVGADKGTLDNAKAALGADDFVTLYVNSAGINSESDVYFGRITKVEGDIITFEASSAQDIRESGDLYKKVALDGEDMITPEEQEQLEQTIQAQVDNSGFGEDAAYMLLTMVSQTDSFQNAAGLRNVSIQDGNGNPLSDDSIQYLAGIGDVGLNSVDTEVRLITSGDDLHYKNKGVQLAVKVHGEFKIVTHEQGELTIKLEATFVQEVAFTPTVKGNLVYKELLGFIPVPTGVQVTANVDIMNYSFMDIDAGITTTDDPVEELVINLKDELNKMMELASGEDAGEDGDSEGEGGVSQYVKSLGDLMDRYSELIEKETEWAQLVEQDMFDTHTPAEFGVVFGIQGKFVVQADLDLAIGSELEYEMGKRYSFWFRVGLFTPTSGSSSMDLIDESLAFQFYVMGRMGLKVGVQAKIYAAIGSADVASVGITTEVGPYLKLYGFFIYDYRTPNYASAMDGGGALPERPDRKAGAMYLDFGLYLAVGVEATAWEWTAAEAELVDKEYPLLSDGSRRYYYDTAYEPLDDADEIVVYNNGSLASPRPGCAYSMVLPDYTRGLRYIDLVTGAQGVEALNPNDYIYTVSNPNFQVDVVGNDLVVSVKSIPENVQLMQCDLTITYKHGKLAFSTFDMTATVHLVWTNMTAQEYQQVYTASVVVPDGNGGMETIWTKRVRKGEPFPLPTDAEIRGLLNWTDAKYIATTGYGDQQTEGLTIVDNKQYTYNLDYQRYALTVSGIQGGSESSRTFTARYGESFDFSALLDTGSNGPTEYTRFAGLTLNGENLDLSRTVTGSFAETVRAGNNAAATARYVDDSVTATFTFTGLEHEDVVVKLRKGGTPDTSAVDAVVREAQKEDPNLAISRYYPDIGPIDGDTVYQVVCEMRQGERFTVTFNSNGGGEFEPIIRVDGVILGALPTPTRVGYSFGGWYTDNGTFQNAVDVSTVVKSDMTLYAKWTPMAVTVTFNTNGGTNLAESERTVYYGQPYGELPVPERSGYGFLGWFTAADDSGVQVTAETVVSIAERHTLYAHWRQRTDIPDSVFSFTQKTATYDKEVHLAQYTFVPGGLDGLTEDSFTVEYVRQQDEFMAENTSMDDRPITAGTYNVRIFREADEFYNRFDHTYTGVLVINRATRSLDGVTNANIDIVETGLTYVKAKLVNVDDLDENAYIAYKVYSMITATYSNGTVIDYNYGTLVYDNQEVESGLLYDLSSVMSSSYLNRLPFQITDVRILGDINYADTDWQGGLTKEFTTKTKVPTEYPSYGSSAYDISWITWYNTTDTEFHLKTAEDLAGLAFLVNYVDGTTQGAHRDSFAGKTIYLDNDIDLSGYKWSSIGSAGMLNGASYAFSGTFDGQGHTISGLYCFDENGYIHGTGGLFGYVIGATIKNVRLTDSLIYTPTIETFEGVGGLVANIYSEATTIENCYSSALIRYMYNGLGSGRGGGEYVYDMAKNTEKTGGARARIYGYKETNATVEMTNCKYLPLVKFENEKLYT